MLRTAVLLLVACAVCVQGLGFVNPLLIPESVRNNQALLRLYRDLVYSPTNVETALPLRNLVLLERTQAVGVYPFNAAVNSRVDAFNDPTFGSTALAFGVVVSVGPNVQQRELLSDGRSVVFATAGCQTLLLSGQQYSICPESNVRGAVDVADGTPAAQRFVSFVTPRGAFGGATPNLGDLATAAFVARDATFV